MYVCYRCHTLRHQHQHQQFMHVSVGPSFRDCSLLPSHLASHSCSPGTPQNPSPCPALPCLALPAKHADAGTALDSCLYGRLGWMQI